MKRKSYIMLITSMTVLGTIGVFRRYIPVPSALLALSRGLIGGIFLLICIAVRKKGAGKRLDGKTLALLCLNGALIGVNWMLFFEGLSYTSVPRATLCYYMQPTIVLLTSPLIFGERLTGKKLLCALAAIVGMVLVSGVLEGGGMGPDDVKGMLLALGAACFYSAVVILNKKITGLDAYVKTTVQLFAAAAVMLPYVIADGELAAVTLSAGAVLLIAAVGVIHTGAAYALYFGSMEGLHAQTISAMSYIDPVTAMVVSAAVLGEKMTAAGVAGAVLIIGSAIIGERKNKNPAA